MIATTATTRAGLVAALASTLPVAVWLGAELLGGSGRPSPSEPLMRSAVDALCTTQALAVLLLPRGLGETTAGRAVAKLRPSLLGASLVLVSAPAPLWVAIAFSGVVPLGGLGGRAALVAVFAILAPQALATCEGYLAWRVSVPLARIATVSLEVAAALAIWTSSPAWAN